MNGSGMSGWGWVGMALAVIAAVTIVALMLWAVALGPEGWRERAHERLDERLARGETDAQEYRRQLKAGTTHRA